MDPQRTQLGTYDHVYVDVNNVLHVAAHHTKTEEAFFKKLFALLDRTMRLTRPQYTVTLALDGPAPIAKTITQRRRRIRLSSGEKVPLSEDAPRLLKIGLTPGSTLALRIDRALEYYAATRLLSRNHLPRGVLFEISGTRVPGEGEVKVLRSMKTREKNARFKGHSHLIVSEDSDALLLALTAEPANVFVLSSKVRSKRSRGERRFLRTFSPGASLRPGSLAFNPDTPRRLSTPLLTPLNSTPTFACMDNYPQLVFSAAAFNASLADELPRGVGIAGARRDFVALAVMMGNDYLPGSRFGVKYSWRAYRQLRTGEPGPWITVDEEEELLDPADGDGVDVAIPSSSNHSVAKDVAWGKYRDTPLFPAPTERDLSEDVYRWGDGHARGAAFTAGKMAFRHPPPVHWEMLRDFSKVLSDPEYVKRQVHDGLRPRADVQRSVNAAAALVAWFGDDDDDDDDAGDDEDDDDDDDDAASSSSSSAMKAAVVEPRVANVAGVGGVLRASADPQQSTRRAYEYVQAVGWVLEMYYAGACLDYGYNFVYPTTDSKSDMSEADLNEATKATLAAAAAAAKVAPGGGGGNSANNGNNNGNNAANANPGGRTQLPPVHPVDVADFISIPLTYDPTLDPLRDPERASIAYLNRFPITPLAYSLAVIPRGGRSLLARGVRPLVDPGSPVYHLFRDDYCVTCIKHRITAGPLERVIQREAEGGGGDYEAEVGDGQGPHREQGGEGAAREKVCRRRRRDSQSRARGRRRRERVSPKTQPPPPHAHEHRAAARARQAAAASERPRGRGGASVNRRRALRRRGDDSNARGPAGADLAPWSQLGPAGLGLERADGRGRHPGVGDDGRAAGVPSRREAHARDSEVRRRRERGGESMGGWRRTRARASRRWGGGRERRRRTRRPARRRRREGRKHRQRTGRRTARSRRRERRRAGARLEAARARRRRERKGKGKGKCGGDRDARERGGRGRGEAAARAREQSRAVQRRARGQSRARRRRRRRRRRTRVLRESSRVFLDLGGDGGAGRVRVFVVEPYDIFT